MTTATLKEILEDFVKEYALGRAGTTTAADSTSTVTDLTRFGRPSAGNEFQRNTPLRITGRAAIASAGITIGSESYVSDFAPATGIFTVTPVWNDGPEVGTEFIVLFAQVADSTNRLLEALNRFLQRQAHRRDKMVLTQAGAAASLMGATSLWTTVTATLLYVDGTLIDYQFQRYLQVTASGSDAYATPGSFGAQANEVYDFYVPAVRPTSDAVAKVQFFDATNTVEITPTFLAGSASITGATPQDVRGYFTVPATCKRVQPRYTVTVSGKIASFGPLHVMRRGAMQLPAPVGVETAQQLGQLYTIPNLQGTTAETSGIGDDFVPVNLGYTVAQRGFGNILQFQEPVPFPLFVDATIPYPALVAGDPTGASVAAAASESDTTYCPKELALKGMAVEFFEWAQAEERRQRGSDSHATRWDSRLLDAQEQLVTAQSDLNAKRRITVRKHFSGFARA